MPRQLQAKPAWGTILLLSNFPNALILFIKKINTVECHNIFTVNSSAWMYGLLLNW